MKITLSSLSPNNATNLATRCPHCGHFGTFEGIQAECKVTNATNQQFYIGVKRCPNANCMGQVFFIKSAHDNKVLKIYPSEVIPFDKENIPQRVLNAFEEAIKCHSENCFIAAAIMIRKTLEEICHERGALGKNLKDRLKVLGDKILIPNELLSGLDDLRLLGNDAAHIETNTFAEIGQEELEVSIDFAKEILKAVYQYENLLQKLRKLKNRKNQLSDDKTDSSVQPTSPK